MRRWGSLALTILLSGSAWAKPWVVVVGIDDYINPAIPDLRYACSDAKLLSQAAEQLLKVPRERIFTFTSDSLLENELPRVTNIVYRLDWLRTHCQPDDTVIFYFAGHGMSADGETYLLTEESDNRSQATLKNSALNSRELTQLLRTSPAKQTLLLLDACRNNPQATSGGGAALDLAFSSSLSLAAPSQESATLFACSVGQRSWEWEAQKHGLFTYFLFEGLRQAAATPSGQVTVGSLFEYLAENVARTSLTISQAPQRPILRYEGPSANRWVLTQVKLPPNLKAGAQGVAQMDAQQTSRDLQQAQSALLQSKLEVEENRRKQLEVKVEALEKQVKSANPSELVEQLTLSRDLALKELIETRKKLEQALSKGAGAEVTLIEAEKEQLRAENKVLVARIALLEGKANQGSVSLSREVFLQTLDPVEEASIQELEDSARTKKDPSLALRAQRLRLEQEVTLAQRQRQSAEVVLRGLPAPKLSADAQAEMQALDQMKRVHELLQDMAASQVRYLQPRQKLDELRTQLDSSTAQRLEPILRDLGSQIHAGEVAYQALRKDYDQVRQATIDLTRDDRFRRRVISRRFYQINRLPGFGDILDVPIRVEEANSLRN